MDPKKETIISDIRDAARAAGKEILAQYHNAFPDAQKKEFPVTVADTAAQTIITRLLKAHHPDIPILSEEKKDDRSYRTTPHCFIVDPLDGTKDFVGKTGEFSVMIAYVENGSVMASAVYQPIGDVLYWALRGKGAYKESEEKTRALQVSDESDVSSMKLVTSRFHLKEYEMKVKEFLHIENETKMGSAGLKMAAIAEGSAHIYINASPETGEWDTAAGSLIVEEAGGMVTDRNGAPLQFGKEDPHNTNGFVVSNGVRHDEIVKALQMIAGSA